MPQTCFPDKARNLPNLNLKPGDKDFGALAARNLGMIGGFKKRLNRFLQILSRRLYRIALTRDIQRGAQTHISITFTLNDRGELYVLHNPPDSF
jgi:hypothetical protein